MKIYFYFKHLTASDALQQYARDHVIDRLAHLCSSNCWMHITFDGTSTEPVVSIDFFSGYRQHLYAKAVGDDIRRACRDAVDSIAKQINKRKDARHNNRERSAISFINWSQQNSFATEPCDGDILKMDGRNHITMS